jgi:hypothetical protein
MKKIVLTVLAMSVLSLNFVSAYTSSNQFNYLKDLKNVDNKELSGNSSRIQPQASVLAGLVVLAVTLFTSAAWSGMGGAVADQESLNNSADVNAYNLD